ncbi:MAG: asparagine--tRNA ligase [Spirochaetes bacterium]|nr:asparagine--tRNA ligase [Spirochaetota bacterium]
MKRTRIRDIMAGDAIGQECTVQGWVRTRRDSKGVSFLELNDGSTIKNLQVVIDEEYHGGAAPEQQLANGCSVVISGRLVSSQGKEQAVELKARSIEILGEAPAEEYPLQKKRHSFEYLREIAHLRPRTNTFGSVARVRSEMSFAIHRFFHERGFIYVHTPIITGSDCEGAGDMFTVTTLPLENVPKNGGEIDYSGDFFGKKASLTVSGQLEGETYACALTDIYTFGPTFRAENSNTSRHLAEFWMIEPEMAFCDITRNMDVAEEFLKYIFTYLLDHCGDDMDFFDSRINRGVKENLANIVQSSFERITYTHAVELLSKTQAKFEYPVQWGLDLQSEHERYITETVYGKPVIITDYPKEIKAFYMKLNDDDRTVRAMDILVPRLGEIIGGSERESDLGRLKQRIIDLGLNPDDYWWYLDLRRFGSVPHSGFGLGFERLIQFVTGMQNIRDVIPFPRCVKTLDF